ncbi:hypothetical protein [Streptomyces sp. SLBN-31]|uniref:hypothetical protein n=1 Tax=Streptomyces sp. SLBN-31 TaxID=2768444 RepID=UPI0021B31147|nr:hypothetical protein [Streptomyces sp. SLBN-31]
MADAAYGLWPLVILNTMLLIAFAASFFHPTTRRDRRARGARSAFLVALFTEMYGTPLTAVYAARTPRFVPRRHTTSRTPRSLHSATREEHPRCPVHIFGG